nr:integrase, catalytic region, zinc finger, CCHC-type, peptidase aspartic, catalytic [Tanacetum cinerariifolium]
MKVLNKKNADLLAQTEVLQDQLKIEHVVIDTHTECQAQNARLKEEIYEYMIRYSALCDNDKQHRKKIDEQKILFDKMSRQNRFENPSYFGKAKDLRPGLYDERVIGLGDTRSAHACNNARNAYCNSYDVDVNDLFVFDDIVQICLWIIDSGCSKHMTGNSALLTNFVEKFLGTVCFGNNDFAVIAGYGDVVIGSMTIKKVYYVEGLGHNLSSIGKFCDKGLEVAFRKSTCFVHNEDGVDLLIGDCSSNLYTIALNEIALNSLACLLAKASSLQSWLWNQTLVEAARTMLTFANLPLFLWAETIKTACFTQNHSIIHKRFDKTPYEVMDKRKPNIKFFHVFECRCYLLNDYDDVGKLKAKGDIGVFVGYFKKSAAFRIYSKRTRKIHDSVNVNFDEISKMASKQFSLEPGLSNLNETVKSLNPSVLQVSETSKKDLEDLLHNFYDEYFDSSKIMKSLTMNVETSNVEIPSQEEDVFHESFESFLEESSSSSLNDDVQQSLEEVIIPQKNTHSISNDMILNVDEASTSHNVFNERLEDAYFDANLMIKRFEMSMMGEMKFFLGLQVNQFSNGIFINQSKYILNILKRFRMKNYDTVPTPMVDQAKLKLGLIGKPVDHSDYRSMIRSLIFTKIIIDYLMSKDQSISRKNKMFWHTARDDTVYTSMRCIFRHEKTQVYGTILPKELTDQAMLESTAYQTYYTFASGKKTPKPNKKDLHISHASGSGDGVETQSKVLDERQQKTSGTNKGTGTIPRVLDVPIYDSKSDKESWGNSDEEDDDIDDFKDDDDNDDVSSKDHDDESDDEKTKSERYEISDPNLTNVDHTEHEKEDVDGRVHTPSEYELIDDEKIHDEENVDEEEEDEVTKELYDDVNVNLENEDTKMTNADQDDNEIASLMDTIAYHATSIPEITSSFTTPTPPPPLFFNPLSQQATLTLTPAASKTTTSLLVLLDFTSVFKFNERVTNMEKDLSEIKRVDQYAQVLSFIPAIVITP